MRVPWKKQPTEPTRSPEPSQPILHRLNPFTSELPDRPDITEEEFDRDYQTMWEEGRGNAVDSNDIMPGGPGITPA
jgi:hypothetical protein